MPSEDVLLSVTPPSVGDVGLGEAGLPARGSLMASAVRPRVQMEVIGGVLACRPGQTSYGVFAPGFLAHCRTARLTGCRRLGATCHRRRGYQALPDGTSITFGSSGYTAARKVGRPAVCEECLTGPRPCCRVSMRWLDFT
jgi:hypothetical protein